MTDTRVDVVSAPFLQGSRTTSSLRDGEEDVGRRVGSLSRTLSTTSSKQEDGLSLPGADEETKVREKEKKTGKEKEVTKDPVAERRKKEKEENKEENKQREEKNKEEQNLDKGIAGGREKKRTRERIAAEGLEKKADKEDRQMIRMVTRISRLSKQERELLKKLLDETPSGDPSAEQQEQEEGDRHSQLSAASSPKDSSLQATDHSNKPSSQVSPTDRDAESSIRHPSKEKTDEEAGTEEVKGEPGSLEVPEAADDGESERSSSSSACTRSQQEKVRSKTIFLNQAEDNDGEQKEEEKVTVPAGETQKAPPPARWKSRLAKWGGVLLGIATVVSTVHFGIKHYKKRKRWPNGITERSFHRQVNRFYS